jgi:hypothetical protein
MHDPLQPNSHEPNPEPPEGGPAFTLVLPDGSSYQVSPSDLAILPQTAVADCFIVSTGHGTSGPFAFSGVRLADLVGAYSDASWRDAAVVSADGFGNRVLAEEALAVNRPIILATHIDGRPLARSDGLVRLIVPGEKDDALRQVKWIGRIIVNA